MRRRQTAAGSLLVLLLCAVPAPAQGAGPDDTGYAFAPLFGHDGRTRLSDLYGSPVLITGFRKRIPEGLHAAWLGHAVHDKYARAGCVVIVRDVERWNPDHHGAMTRSFWLRFFESSPWLTCVGEPLPFREGGPEWTDRSLVLIGVDGEVVLQGAIDDYEDRPRRDGFQARVLDALETELERRRDGWGDHRAIRRIRSTLFDRGDIAQAWKMAGRLADDEAPEEQERVRREIRDHLAVALRAIGRLLDDGRYADAADRLDDLEKSVRGVDEFEASLAPLRERLASDEAKAGAKAERRIERLLRPFAKRDFREVEADEIWRLRELAEEHEGTPIAARLERLDPFVVAVYCAMRGIVFAEREKKLAEERR